MFEEIATQIREAAANREKAAMIHFLVLVNAGQLENVSAEDFCVRVGIEPSWEIEFKKMINLARMLDTNGYALTKK